MISKKEIESIPLKGDINFPSNSLRKIKIYYKLQGQGKGYLTLHWQSIRKL